VRRLVNRHRDDGGVLAMQVGLLNRRWKTRIELAKAIDGRIERF